MLPPEFAVLEVPSRAKEGQGSVQGVTGRAISGVFGGHSGTSRIVGTMSMTWPGSRLSSPREGIPLGQATIGGVAMPPSCTQVLWRA